MQSAIIAETAEASQWQLYLVRTSSGSLYAGISTNPQRRLRQHRGELSGGARALRGKGPLTLVWTFATFDRSHASALEYQLKQLKKADKERLVQGHWQPDWLLHSPASQSAIDSPLPASTEVA